MPQYKIDIREANCLCAFIHIRPASEEESGKYKGKYIHTLYSFFVDGEHVKNIMKDNNGKLFMDEVISLSLNLYYKQSEKLLKIFTKAGYQVTCYYEKVK